MECEVRPPICHNSPQSRQISRRLRPPTLGLLSLCHVSSGLIARCSPTRSSQLLEAIPIIHPANGMATTTLILGSVKCIHVREDVLNERGNVDITKFKPVGRLGDISYVRIGAPLRVPRSTYEAEQEKIGQFLKNMGA